MKFREYEAQVAITGDNYTFGQYQLDSAATAVYPRKEGTGNFIYTVLGLNEEAGEVAEAVIALQRKSFSSYDERLPFINEVVAELGDVLWYAAATCREIDASLDEVAEVAYGYGQTYESLSRYALELNTNAGKVAGHVKKLIRDDNGVMTTERKKNIIFCLGQVIKSLQQIASWIGVPLEDVAKANIAKLQDRKARKVLQGSGDHR